MSGGGRRKRGVLEAELGDTGTPGARFADMSFFSTPQPSNGIGAQRRQAPYSDPGVRGAAGGSGVRAETDAVGVGHVSFDLTNNPGGAGDETDAVAVAGATDLGLNLDDLDDETLRLLLAAENGDEEALEVLARLQFLAAKNDQQLRVWRGS